MTWVLSSIAFAIAHTRVLSNACFAQNHVYQIPSAIHNAGIARFVANARPTHNSTLSAQTHLHQNADCQANGALGLCSNWFVAEY